jgi:hypothetical protein
VGNDAVYTLGKVGIGTTSPAEALHVIGNGRFDGTLFADALDSAGPLELRTAGTTRLFIDDATGNVGIGTTSPPNLLTLEGGATVRQSLRTLDPAGITSLRFEAADGSGNAEMWFDSNTNELSLKAIPAGGTLNLLAGPNAVMRVFPSGGMSVRGPNQNGLAIGAASASSASITYLVPNGGITRMYLHSAFTKFQGRVGIDRDPAVNDLEINGTASKTTAGDWLANSDARIKTDVQTVRDALETLDRVRLVQFRYTDDYRAAHPKIEDRVYLNVIAQEFAQVFPEHVKSSGERLPDGSEILQVDTYPLTIYAAAGVQALHRLVRDQNDQIAALRRACAAQASTLATLEARLAALEGAGVEQTR